MINNTNKKVSATLEELEIADSALKEYSEKGQTEIKCPRCNSKLEINIYDSADDVKCSKCDFRITYRGI